MEGLAQELTDALSNVHTKVVEAAQLEVEKELGFKPFYNINTWGVQQCVGYWKFDILFVIPKRVAVTVELWSYVMTFDIQTLED